MTDFTRVAQNVTIRAKAWVKLSPKLLFWPCVLFVRRPKLASEVGESYLRNEGRVYIIPCGPEKAPLKPYKHGVWLSASNTAPFTRRYDERLEKGSSSIYTAQFMDAVHELKHDPSSVDFDFKFKGTFEIRELEHQKMKELKCEREAIAREKILLAGQARHNKKQKRACIEDVPIGTIDYGVRSREPESCVMIKMIPPPNTTSSILPSYPVPSIAAVKSVVGVLHTLLEQSPLPTSDFSIESGSKPLGAHQHYLDSSADSSVTAITRLDNLFPWKLSNFLGSALSLTTDRDGSISSSSPSQNTTRTHAHTHSHTRKHGFGDEYSSQEARFPENGEPERTKRSHNSLEHGNAKECMDVANTVIMELDKKKFYGRQSARKRENPHRIEIRRQQAVDKIKQQVGGGGGTRRLTAGH